MAAPCVEHVAVRVRDFEAALAFFTDVMGMEITLTDPASGESPLNQAWVGGIQLQRDEAGSGDYSGDVSHIGLVADDVDALLEAVYAQRASPQNANLHCFPLVKQFQYPSTGAAKRCAKAIQQP